MHTPHVLTLLLLAGAGSAVQLSAAEPPNIIVLMLDDLDQRSLDDMLAEGLLPNIQQRVVDRAVHFTEAFTTESLCCPSRATFLSGKYPHNTGIIQNFALYDALPNVPRPRTLLGDAGRVSAPADLPEDKVWLGTVGEFDDSDTLAVRLQERGYNTGHVGKYLHGYGGHPFYVERSPAFDPGYVPPGWTTWATLVDPTTYCVYDYAINVDGQIKRYDLAEGETQSDAIYQTHVLSNLAAAFVRQHQHEAAPFYLQIDTLAPHMEVCESAYAPEPIPDSSYRGLFLKKLRAPPRDDGRYVPTFVPRGAYDDDNSDKPDYLARLDTSMHEDDRAELLAAQYQGRLRSLYAVDRLVGALFDALDPDTAERTVLVFTSDNGWLYGQHRLLGKQAGYEESIRIPLYVRYPGRTSPARSDAIVLNTDFMPTLLELTGHPYRPGKFDGTSFAPFIADPTRTDVPRRRQFLASYFSGQYSLAVVPSFLAVRTREAMYIRSDSSDYDDLSREELVGLEFYDLVADPTQAVSEIRLGEGDAPAVFHRLVDELSRCSGQSCRFWEYLPLP
jgi:N-acetylglucosamine-6-sulfatase